MVIWGDPFMNNLPILLLDPVVERACDTQFLLQLANYTVAVVHNDDEAFNWVVNRRDSAENPVLLLCNYFQAEMPILQLIPQLRQQTVAIPVLFVCRDNVQECAVIASVKGTIYCCRPENMLSQIKTLVDCSAGREQALR